MPCEVKSTERKLITAWEYYLVPVIVSFFEMCNHFAHICITLHGGNELTILII